MKSLLQAILIGLTSLLFILAFYLLSAPALSGWNAARRMSAYQTGHVLPHLESRHTTFATYNAPLHWMEHHYEWTREPLFHYRSWLGNVCFHLFYTPPPRPLTPAPITTPPDPFAPEP